MAKFSFRLQSVLNLKIRLEEQQRTVFASTRKRLSDEEEKLEELYTRKAFYEEEGRSMLKESLHVMDILANGNAIERIKEYIEDQKATIRYWENRVEEERLKLVEMIKERKMYERLREKAFEEYMQEENHTEGVINDEHNSFVYGEKTRNKNAV
jgi:flagellar FliJ protein